MPNKNPPFRYTFKKKYDPTSDTDFFEWNCSPFRENKWACAVAVAFVLNHPICYTNDDNLRGRKTSASVRSRYLLVNPVIACTETDVVHTGDISNMINVRWKRIEDDDDEGLVLCGEVDNLGGLWGVLGVFQSGFNQ